jgi:KipI family sensor histidine kinase inhibitor
MTKKSVENNKYLNSGDSGIFVSFDDRPDAEAVLLARRLGRDVMREGGDGIVDVTPGLKNLLIHYDPLKTSFKSLTAMLDKRLPGLMAEDAAATRHWQIPVLYGGEAGPDIEDVAQSTGLATDDVIERHLGNRLTVVIMGFLPGLAYFRGVDDQLYLPRRSSPRQHVPERSVGIAMDQTVIYPLPSPGGWNLIGRTPVRPFSPLREEPVLFNPGDTVSFTAIDDAEYARLDRAAADGEDIIKPVGET